MKCSSISSTSVNTVRFASYSELLMCFYSLLRICLILYFVQLITTFNGDDGYSTIVSKPSFALFPCSCSMEFQQMFIWLIGLVFVVCSLLTFSYSDIASYLSVFRVHTCDAHRVF